MLSHCNTFKTSKESFLGFAAVRLNYVKVENIILLDQSHLLGSEALLLFP